MRILHVISGIEPQNGGPALALRGFAVNQAARGDQVTVLSTYQRPEALNAAQQLQQLGVMVRLIGPARGKFSSHPDLRGAARSLVASSDVVHIHGLYESAQHHAAVEAQAARLPYIFRPCGMLDPWSLRQSWLVKRIYRTLRLDRNLKQAAALHVMTELERGNVAALGLNDHLIVEPNGVNFDDFDPPPEPGTFRRRLALGDGPLLLFLGRLHPKKGLDLLLHALADLHDQGGLATDLRLAVVGPDDAGYTDQMRRLADDRRLGEHVQFCGLLTGRDRASAFADADLFVLTSYQENFGIAVAEAMAAGTAVLISDQVALKDDVTAADAGQITTLDPADIRTALARCLADSDVLREQGKRGRTFARDRYDWAKIADRWDRHYRRLIN